jgi:hypothetical protein
MVPRDVIGDRAAGLTRARVCSDAEHLMLAFYSAKTATKIAEYVEFRSASDVCNSTSSEAFSTRRRVATRLSYEGVAAQAKRGRD